MPERYLVRRWALNVRGSVYSRESRHSTIEAAENELESAKSVHGVFRIAIMYLSEPPVTLKVWLNDRAGGGTTVFQSTLSAFASEAVAGEDGIQSENPVHP